MSLAMLNTQIPFKLIGLTALGYSDFKWHSKGLNSLDVLYNLNNFPHVV
jgi:hypothetical protein